MIETKITPIQKCNKRCSNCVSGHQLVAGVMGGSLNKDGSETYWLATEIIPIGQTRNCFTRLERVLAWFDFIKLRHFIYPNEDDTCIYPKRFKQK